MTLNSALVWKEYREVRGFVLAGLAVFVITPLTESLGYWKLEGHFYSDYGESLVYALGGLLAVFIAIAETCRDLDDGLQKFWQSRPIGLARWLLIKYAVGLTAVMLTCGTPLVLQMILYSAQDPSHLDPGAYTALTSHSLTLAFVYSTSFLVGCLIRNSTHAAIMSFALALIIYFLPVIVPALRWLSFFIVTQNFWGQGRYGSDYVPFALAMLMGCAAVVCLAYVGVKRDWKLSMDQRLIFWLLGAVALILFSTIAFQLGTNLDCVREIAIKPEGSRDLYTVNQFAVRGDQGIMAICRQAREPGPIRKTALSIRRFDLSQAKFFVGGEVLMRDNLLLVPQWYDRPPIVWSGSRPQRAYVLVDERTTDAALPYGVRKSLTLCTIALDGRAAGVVIHQVNLMPFLTKLGNADVPRMCLHEGSIYIAGDRQVLMVSLSNPDSPEVDEVREDGPPTFDLKAQTGPDRERPVFNLSLMSLPGLCSRARLGVFMQLVRDDRVVRSFAFQDDLLVVATGKHLTTYRLLDVHDDVATFEQIGQRQATVGERMMHVQPTGPMMIHDGLVYVVEFSLGKGLTVYDIRDPERPKRLGHYAAPNDRLCTIAPVPNGDVLLGGASVHVIAAPMEEPP